ncbi:DUF4134 family protein [Massilibacteroides vaginae]|uniref:DUF4134 family protein n=1 Tax=Massilibacteroides vaginae TaxID=1673718 RepID=UPI000A1CD274|nr:DUF4134 family protein [Massilibacteroides vaginae]
MKSVRRQLRKVERKFIFTLASLLIFYECLLAQSGISNGVAAINEATSEIKSLYDPVKKLIWVIAAVLGVVGAVRIYAKIQGKDPESSKHALAFVLGAIALLVGETFIRKTFID